MGIRINVQSTFLLSELTDSILAGTVQGMNQAGEYLLGKSLEEVPMDQLTLAQSGTVVHTTDVDTPVQVVYDTPYAARLHEHPEYQFSKKSNAGAKGKYLEDPAVENRKEMGDIVRAAARGELLG